MKLQTKKKKNKRNLKKIMNKMIKLILNKKWKKKKIYSIILKLKSWKMMKLKMLICFSHFYNIKQNIKKMKERDKYNK